MSNTDDHISSAAPLELEHDPINDIARKPVEPARANRSKLVIAGIVGFVVFLVVCFFLVTLAKQKIGQWNQSRVAAAEEKKQKNAETASSRKAISFANMIARQKTSDVATPAPTTAAPVPLVGAKNGINPATGQAGAPQQAVKSPPLPSMMVDSGEMNAGGANSGGSIAGNSGTRGPADQQRLSPEQLIDMVKKVQAGAGQAPNQAGQPAQLASNATSGMPIPRSVQEVAERSRNPKLTDVKQVSAANLGNRDYVLTRGHHMPCVLETQIMSNLPGTTACILTENIYSTNGHVLLLEKGTRAVGEYKTAMKVGDSRLAILWERVETPTGVIIDLDSPTADQIGAAGIDGWVDNHWFERIGAAFLLSYVKDAIQYKTAQQQAGSNNTNSPTYSTSTNTSSDLTKKVLDSTINIAPTMVKNRGELINIEVAHDLWFQDVYTVNR